MFKNLEVHKFEQMGGNYQKAEYSKKNYNNHNKNYDNYNRRGGRGKPYYSNRNKDTHTGYYSKQNYGGQGQQSNNMSSQNITSSGNEVTNVENPMNLHNNFSRGNRYNDHFNRNNRSDYQHKKNWNMHNSGNQNDATEAEKLDIQIKKRTKQGVTKKKGTFGKTNNTVEYQRKDTGNEGEYVTKKE